MFPLQVFFGRSSFFENVGFLHMVRDALCHHLHAVRFPFLIWQSRSLTHSISLLRDLGGTDCVCSALVTTCGTFGFVSCFF